METPIPPANTGMTLKEINDQRARMALAFSKANILPKQYHENIGNCLIALELSERMGLPMMQVCQSLYIVHGMPTWSAQFCIAAINSTPRFRGGVEYDYDDSDPANHRCRAYATSATTGQVLYGEWVSMALAKAEGWSEKNGSKWKTMPGQMLRYRSASWFARVYCPELLMGMLTREEAEDIRIEDTTFTEVAAPGTSPAEPMTEQEFCQFAQDCPEFDKIADAFAALPAVTDAAQAAFDKARARFEHPVQGETLFQ